MIRGEESNDDDGHVKSIKVTGCSRMLSKQTKMSNKPNSSTFYGLEESSTDFVLTETDAQVSFRYEFNEISKFYQLRTVMMMGLGGKNIMRRSGR